MKTCPNCGQPALDSHRFCMRCGDYISAAPITDNQAQYAHSHETMGALASNGSTKPSETGAMLIDDVLAKGEKSGYRFAYEHVAPAKGQPESYSVTATPLVQNQSGVRSFFSDETGI